MKKLLILLSLLLSFVCFGETKIITLEKGDFFVFEGEVNGSTVSTALNALRVVTEERQNYVEKLPVYMILNTPGGEVDSGNELIEVIRSIDLQVDTITKFAASMGFHFAQNSNKRYILESGTLMSHKIRGGVQGEFGQPNSQLDNRLEYWKQVSKRMDEVVVKKNGKITLEQYWKLMENEYWCEGQKCVDDGFADEVVKVRCGKSLIGVKDFATTLDFLGMKIKVTAKQPECPLYPMFDINLDFGNGKESLADTEGKIQDRVKKFFNIK